MKTKLFHASLVVLTASSLFLAIGCESTSTVQSVAKDGANFSNYKSYALVDSGLENIVPGVSPAEILWTKEIVELELARWAYLPVDANEADIIVLIETDITGGREKGGFSIGLGTGSYSRRGGSSVGVSTGPIGAGYIEQSTLTIRIIDRKTDGLLWAGWIDKLENNKFTALEFKAKVREIMSRMPHR